MKSLSLYFSTIVLITGLLSTASAQNDSKGKDFWLMFDRNFSPPTLTIFVTSSVNTSGTISGPSFAPIPFTVTANTVTPVVVPTSLATHTNDVVDNKGIHVTALDDVTVYGLNYVPFTTDAYLGLPTDALGTEYLIVAYTGIGRGTILGVVGTQDGTTVTITPTATVGSHTAGVPFNITLNQGQTYELETSTADLTGTVITSTKPVGVMGAAQCANIPDGYSYCDHICEMIPPTSTWGKKFVTVPLASRTNGDTWRFLASENNTVVTINGVPQAAINRGQFIEKVLTTKSIIESDKPILVAQFANGSTFSGNPGDPFMMLIPPYEQFLPGYTLTTVSGYVKHYINVVAPNSVVGSLTLDGAPVPAASFSPIGASGFSGAQIQVAHGSHTLNASLPFGAFQYGFNNDDSYGYPGGQSFSAVATVSSILLTPQSSSATIGTQQCFNALIKDQFNAPVPGVRVDFNITGPNSASSGFAFTDSDGKALFCYTGASTGTDTVVAVVGTLKDTSVMVWTGACKVEIICGNNIAVNNDSGACGAIVNYTAPAGTGDCNPVTTQIAGLPAGSLFPVGTTTNTFVVTDDANNSDTCSFDVVVTDTEKPSITCAHDTGICKSQTQTYTITALSASDNCGIATVTYQITGATARSGTGYDASGSFNVGTSTITWTVTDVNGNSSECRTMVTIWPLPVVTIVASSPDDFCNKLTLTATPAGNGTFTYAWFLGNTPFATTKAIQLNNANNDGIYKAQVTDSNGCMGEATYNYLKQNIVSNYTILAYDTSHLDQNNNVQTGSVGVMNSNGFADFLKYCSVASPGAFVKANSIVVQNPVNIPLQILAQATVTLPTMQFNTTDVSALPSHVVNANTTVILDGNYKELEIKKGAVVKLNGTIFGKILIQESAQVTFTQPVINMRQLFVKKGATNAYTYVYFTTDASVKVSQSVKIQERTRVNPDSAKVTFYLGDIPDDEEKFMVMANDTRVIANVYMPNGNLQMVSPLSTGGGQNGPVTSYMTGLFIATNVFGRGENVIWNNYSCKPVNNVRFVTATEPKSESALNIPATIITGKEFTVTASPNPFHSSFRITVDSKSTDAITIRITDGLGRLLTSKTGIRPGSPVILNPGFTSGLYYAEIIQGKERKVVKLVKLN